ncbi:MAG TPA: multidrug effflux MFS transporter [Polyangiaceae bacterium]|nr:multidrug effflux MFS transporter [Polyangiaceae bacterium]
MQPTETAAFRSESSSAGVEFVALVALTTSMVAMSIDTMLPALGQIATDLGTTDPNDRQLVLIAFFGGLSVGQLVCGPASDATGRKPALFTGLGLFIAGAVCCALARDFPQLLLGRALQGFGAAGPRIVSVAVVRDLHAGRSMARVMSFVQSVFILVPILAPAFGQAVLSVTGWRSLFWIFAGCALLDAAWFGLRQPETLPPERRSPLSARHVLRAGAEVLSNRITLCYTLATGVVFGAFISYLTTSQQVFQELFGLGKLFPVCFGVCALALGVASFTNASLVMRYGMRTLSRRAVLSEVVFAALFLLAVVLWQGRPPLFVFLPGMMFCFFCNGLLFGNYNARAMQPMGHIAGVAAAISGCLSGLVGMLFGGPLGRAYDGTVTSTVGGFALASLIACALTEYAERGARPD